MRSESEHDCYGAAHAGTALSAALGICAARDQRGSDESVVAIFGDAGLTNGISFEALNNIAQTTRRFIGILNDNEWSIAKNVGAISAYLNKLITHPSYNKLARDFERFVRRLPKGEWLERSLDSCREFGREPFFITRTLALSMLLNTVCVLQVLVLAWGLDLKIPPLVLFLTVPVIICISALPITPSGLGVRENLFVFMLAESSIGVPATSALSLSLLAYAGSLFWSLVGGLVYALLKQRHHLAEAELEKAEAELVK